MPPLRGTLEDILPLAEHFIRRRLPLNRHPVPLPQETAEAIRRYPWPLIRQLEAPWSGRCIWRKAALLPEHFWDCGSWNRGPPRPPGAGERGHPRRRAIAAALVRFGGNISQTAFALRRQPHTMPEDEQSTVWKNKRWRNTGEKLRRGRGARFPQTVGADPSPPFSGLCSLQIPVHSIPGQRTPGMGTCLSSNINQPGNPSFRRPRHRGLALQGHQRAWERYPQSTRRNISFGLIGTRTHQRSLPTVEVFEGGGLGRGKLSREFPPSPHVPSITFISSLSIAACRRTWRRPPTGKAQCSRLHHWGKPLCRCLRTWKGRPAGGTRARA